MNGDLSRSYGMTDEQRIAILADIILDAINAEEAQAGAETEG